MKLSILIFSTVALSGLIDRDILINAPISGISKYLVEKMGSVADSISSHGCHCSRLNGRANIGSSPIDELDRICRNWINKRRCMLKNGGICENGPGFYSLVSDCSSSASACQSLAC